jgi:hypothetical protein
MSEFLEEEKPDDMDEIITTMTKINEDSEMEPAGLPVIYF